MHRTPPSPEPKASRWWLSGWIIVLVLGIILPLILAPLSIILLISIIGIPLFFVLAILPTLCILLLAATLMGGWLRKGPWGYAAGAGLMLGLMCLVPFVLNQRVESAVQALIRDDKGATTPPPAGSTVGLLRRGNNKLKPDRMHCDDLCRRLLLDGRTPSVVVAYEDEGALVPDPATPALAYSLESGRPCAPLTSESPGHWGELPRLAGPNSLERLNLQLAQGRCLIARPARLGYAQTVLAYGHLFRNHGRSTKAERGGEGVDGVSRVTLWSRHDGRFAETYRYTYVTYKTLFPVLAPTIVEGANVMQMKPGFARFTHTARPKDKHVSQIPLAQHLEGWLSPVMAGQDGQNAYNNAPETGADMVRVLRNLLDSRETPTTTQLAVAAAFNDGLRMRRELSPSEKTLLRDLTLDPRFAVHHAAVRMINGNDDIAPADTSRIADAMFQRLRDYDATPGADDPMPDADTTNLSTIGRVIAELPNEDIARHRDDLVWLARNRTLRAPAYQALKRLADQGVSAGQHYLYLIDDSKMFPADARPDRDRNHNDNHYQHPYLAGIQGLCEMGPAAESYLPDLLARMKDGRVHRDGSYGDIAFNALVRMGAPFEVVEAQFKGTSRFVKTGNHRKKYTGERYTIETDVPVRPAFVRATNRVDCSY